MSMFPGAHAQIYKNEAGEVLGWDYPSYDPPDDDRDDQFDSNWERPEPENLAQCIEWGIHAKDGKGIDGWWVCDYCDTPWAQIEDDE